MTRRTALVVDADAASAKLLAVVLESAGWLAIVAHTIEGARGVLGLLRPHVVLLEPGSSFELGLGHLHSIHRASDDSVPIVIVCTHPAWASVSDRACVGHIHKPIDVTTFPAQLEKLLEPTS